MGVVVARAPLLRFLEITTAFTPTTWKFLKIAAFTWNEPS